MTATIAAMLIAVAGAASDALYAIGGATTATAIITLTQRMVHRREDKTRTELDDIDGRVRKLNDKVDTLKDTVSDIKADVGRLDERTQSIAQTLQFIRQDIRDIRTDRGDDKQP